MKKKPDGTRDLPACTWILPTLRGYYTVVDLHPSRSGNCIRIGCAKCKCQRVIYHKENCQNKQTRFQAFCLVCENMIVVEVRRVRGGDATVAPKKKGKPKKAGPYKTPKNPYG